MKNTKKWFTPDGMMPNLFIDMSKQAHVLIAGASGSGKSVVVNDLVYTLLYKAPSQAQFILIDPKRVSLMKYKHLPHTIVYANRQNDMINALKKAVDIMEARYTKMEAQGLEDYIGSDIYVIIDELADLMTTNGKVVTPLIQRLCQLGRAAKIHTVAATQCTLSCVISTTIKVNFDCKVALRTADAQQSRNIMAANGCELLPRHGKAYYITPEYNRVKVNVPKVEDAEYTRLIKHWEAQNGRRFA